MADELINPVTGEIIAIRDEPPEPFTVLLQFRNGNFKEFVVTEFDADVEGDRIMGATWKQDHATPGAELVQFVDWSEVIAVSTYRDES